MTHVDHRLARPPRKTNPHRGCSVARDSKGLARDWARWQVTASSEARTAAMRMARSACERCSAVLWTKNCQCPSRGGISLAALVADLTPLTTRMGGEGAAPSAWCPPHVEPCRTNRIVPGVSRTPWPRDRVRLRTATELAVRAPVSADVSQSPATSELHDSDRGLFGLPLTKRSGVVVASISPRVDAHSRWVSTPP